MKRQEGWPMLAESASQRDAISFSCCTPSTVNSKSFITWVVGNATVVPTYLLPLVGYGNAQPRPRLCGKWMGGKGGGQGTWVKKLLLKKEGWENTVHVDIQHAAMNCHVLKPLVKRLRDSSGWNALHWYTDTYMGVVLNKSSQEPPFRKSFANLSPPFAVP